MQYGHDSAPFHQSGLGQALAYPRTTDYRAPSTSPPSAPAFAVQPTNSPAIKRKHIDNIPPHALKRRRDTATNDDQDPYDIDPAAQGAKHWTDDEKSKLFSWLMGPGQEDHWNALRATKNSCLRDCASEVFGAKKTYQALKGCYERNFNLFKQIYAFETAHGQSAASNASLTQLPEADRLREYERRLQIARKAGSDVGNITARTIDHWHRVGWYDLFYRRWHGDPATTRPVQGRNPSGVGSTSLGGVDDADDEEPNMDFTVGDPSHHNMVNGINGQQQQHPQQHQQQQQQQQQHQQQQLPQQLQQQQQHVYINPQDLRDNPPTSSLAQQQQQQQAASSSGLRHAHSSLAHAHSGIIPNPSSSSSLASSSALNPLSLSSSTSSSIPPSSLISSSSDLSHSLSNPNSQAAAFMGLPLTQDLISGCLHYLNLQAKVAQEKLDYIRRKEAREVSELHAKKELEKSVKDKNKTEKAIELINNPNADANLKQAATEYLRKMFLQD